MGKKKHGSFLSLEIIQLDRFLLLDETGSTGIGNSLQWTSAGKSLVTSRLLVIRHIRLKRSGSKV